MNHYTGGYNGYRPASKPNNTKAVTMALIISWIIIFVGIRWVFFKQPATVDNQLTDSSDFASGSTVRRFVGERVLLAGTISRTSEFTSSHSHLLETEEGQILGLKSGDIDLFAFSGMVELKGEVVDFKKELPIIQVLEIVSTEQPSSDVESGALAGNPDYYYLEEDGLGFDLSISDGYEIREEGEEVHLIDTTTDPEESVLVISPFSCIPGHALQDCTALEEKFTAMNQESFVSSQDITFYNLSETNTRITFNGEGMGYTVRPSNADSLNTFIGFMQFVTPDRLQAFVEEEKEECKSLDATLSGIVDTAFDEMKTGLLKAAIEGTSTEGEAMDCTMYIRLGSVFTVTAAQVETSTVNSTDDEETPDDESDDETDEPEEENDTADEENPEDTETETGAAATDTTTAGIAVNNGQAEKPASFEGWASHQSARGYTVWFSNPSVAYEGGILEESTSLGVNGLTCIYRIQLATWEKADSIAVSPDAEIYECEGALTAQQAQQNNMQIIGSTGGLVFVTKFLTNNLDPLQLYVE